MLLLNIIAMLWVTIMWSENPMVECNTDFFIWGCASPTEKTITLSYNEPDRVLYHELGHILFLDDLEVREVVNKYPAPRKYPDYAYPTDLQKLQERIADYFEMYMRYSDFPDKFPEVNDLFNKKMEQFK